ncbi:Crp/Fnr family transcriptional regulator [Deinococcus radiophilus]|uniref:Crp/Fnr family transcriptional regulator n=1 Tax=Deinococcus radiophilus TaxID=32062 RepID=A0A3S0L925_9DEIO|nr:Crp/Fnr family transcriptional regulator [Deinococcus radiophilus]RTR29895.1 Crp/Fnr family transcriptional regulator [Deinococcus radiophilus]UFA49752.1 Crp/Fnr family transcriptional regulator [Deinococcus radiophilus]
MLNDKDYPSLVWHLKKTELFCDVELDELERVASTTLMRAYRAGEVIYRMDDPADALYLVRSGMVKISKLFPNGKEAILSVIGPHGSFGELLMRPQERRPTQAEAVESTRLIAVPQAELQALLQARPDLALKLIGVLATRLFDAQHWSATVNAYSASERVASLLARLGREFGRPHEGGTELNLKLNQEDLARMVGATRETVSHSLQKLKREGAIIRQRSPFVLNLEALEAYVDGPSK